MPARRDALVTPRLDGWLVGGAAVVLWIVFLGVHALGISVTTPAPAPLAWLLAAVTATHFGISYHLGYAEGGRAVRRHPLSLLLVPIATAALVVVAWLQPQAWFTSRLLEALLLAVFSLTTWHYIKQSYGVARLEASLNGVHLSGRDVAVLRYGLYPLWALSLASLYVRHGTGSAFGYHLGIGLLPTWTGGVLRIACAVAGLLTVATFVHVHHREHRMPWSVWTPHVAAFLWVAFAPNFETLIISLASIHALQYLACAHGAEVALAEHRDQPQPMVWRLWVFGAAAAAGLFLSSWSAPLIALVAGHRDLPAIYPAGVFVLLNLHHYAIDAAIWRTRGAHVQRLVGRPRVDSEPAGTPHDAGDHVGLGLGVVAHGLPVT